jgi:DNA invertase Pin-like site-specific DNA recombinase
VPAGELGVELKQEKVKERERERKKKETRRGKKRKKKKKKWFGVRNPRMMMLMKQNLPPKSLPTSRLGSAAI